MQTNEKKTFRSAFKQMTEIPSKIVSLDGVVCKRKTEYY